MTSSRAGVPCNRMERIPEYVMRALPSDETRALESHISECAECRREMELLRPVVDSFVEWPTDVLRPPTSLWERVAQRVAAATGEPPLPAAPQRWTAEPEWRQVAPGISCKLLATDAVRNRVSMLVRLSPGVNYPPHRHAEAEELHLLAGELWIDERKLYAGEFYRADYGSEDRRVWSETGCTCVLVTSTDDVLR